MIKGELVAVCLYRPYWQLDTLPHTNIMNSCYEYWATHYQLSTIKNLLNLLNFVHLEVSTSKSTTKKYLDDAASAI